VFETAQMLHVVKYSLKLCYLIFSAEWASLQ